MRLDSKDLCIIGVGALAVVIFSCMAYSRTDTRGKTQPRYEGQLSTAGFAGSLVIDDLDTGDHYFHPLMCHPNQTQIFTPHRYPQATGGNITALIHQGFDAMSRQAPQDSDWIERPPGDEMW